MDSLTQIVLGAAVGEAVLGKKVGNKAALYGAIAGTIPDLDVLARFFVDEITAIEWHRGFSHSILFSLLAAPLLGKLVSLYETKASWSDWTKLFFLGLITHPMLDAFTTWGTQLFWPFNINLAFKNIFVIDPLYTLPFLFCLILAMRLPKTSLKRRKYNKIGIILSSTYLLITILLKGITYFQFKAALQEQNIAYQEIQTRPSTFNTVLWNANVKLENEFLLADYSFFDSQTIQFRSFPQNEALLGQFAAEPDVLRLKAITKGWYTIFEDENGNVFLNDLRFGLLSPAPDASTFAFSYRLFNKNDGKLAITEMPKTRGDAEKLLADLWERIQGN
jgi:inner membrane protein